MWIVMKINKMHYATTDSVLILIQKIFLHYNCTNFIENPKKNMQNDFFFVDISNKWYQIYFYRMNYFTSLWCSYGTRIQSMSNILQYGCFSLHMKINYIVFHVFKWQNTYFTFAEHYAVIVFCTLVSK